MYPGTRYPGTIYRGDKINRYTGLKLEGSELSPFSGIGIILEYFQISENLPSLKDLVNNMLSGTETSLATALSILLLISSGLVALFGFKSSMRVCISGDVHSILANLFWHLYSEAGKAKLSSFTAEMEVKYGWGLLTHPVLLNER